MICRICSKSFNPLNKRTLYCSKQCKWKAGNDRRPRLTSKRYSLAKENYLKELDYTTTQIIYGSLLGDGCLIKKIKGHRFSLCSKDSDYLEWKKSLTRYIFQQLSPSNYTRKDKRQIFFYHSISHPFFTTIYDIFYRDKKIVTRDILNKIDKLGLSVWYQDDGSFNHRKESRQITLCTDSFTLEQHKIIQKWFMDKWSIEVKIQFIKATKTSFGKKSAYRIRINKFEVPKFIALVKHFIQPCMFHKLPS